MKIVFFGSDKFGIPSLEALVSAGYSILCIVTQPDRYKGRGLRMEGTPIKKIASRLGIKLFQPEDVNSRESVDYLKKVNADLFIIIAYGQIFSQEALDIPKIMPINLHASLLPAYRGAAPINWAFIKGEEKTGVTIAKVTAKLDSGPIILQEETAISKEDSVVSLEDRLAQIGAKLLLEAVVAIGNKNYQLLPQDEKKATFAPKLKKSDGAINWNTPAQDIYNLIRGCAGWPGAFTHYKNRLLKVHKAKIFPASKSPACAGEIIKADKEGISVATATDNLVITELQLEAGKIMSAAQFISGHRLNIGERLVTKTL
ncbi:MAG: methionyl-tRNA formyltransferase [Candidatus Omnitrophica bacterium]|nr:methionyl-tRNA formyltransferase [Candidatus Omnitrophota bacterium]